MAASRLQQMEAVMQHQDRIRNISVIAHVDHGKSTLTDTLVHASGVSKKAHFTGTLEAEAQRGITIKSTGVSFIYQNEEGADVLVNLIDSPGHMDFAAEVTAALRVTDGAVVVVDAVEGPRVQTDSVLRQALEERIKPVLAINKFDRLILELQCSPEEAYQLLIRTIDSVNRLVDSYNDGTFGDYQVSPIDGTVVFGSALHEWAFSLETFSQMYAEKLGLDEAEFRSKLWGDWWVDGTEFVQTPINEKGKKLPRAFCKFVLAPIYKLTAALTGGEETADEAEAVMASLGITVSDDTLMGKKKLAAALANWLPAAPVFSGLIVKHLPAPTEAQAYRAELLYTGPQDDAVAEAIRNCDPDGPLAVYISKLVPTADFKRFSTFGRVFAGTVRPGVKVNVLGPEYVMGERGDAYMGKAVQRVSIMMGGQLQSVESMPCGNTVTITGLDNYIAKTATLTDADTTYPLKTMKFTVSPVVRVAVSAKNPTEAPKLIKGLQRLSKSDPQVVCTMSDDTDEYIVAATGELHLEVVLNDLVTTYAGIEIVATEPVVAFSETVVGRCEPQLAKSTNKHNRVAVSASALGDELTAAIDAGSIPVNDSSSLPAVLREGYGWDTAMAKRLWGFGPDGIGPNAIVNESSGVAYLNEVRDSLMGGFNEATYEGVLCGEPLRGVLFAFEDGQFHGDAPHRGVGQVLPTAKRAMHAAQLAAEPRIVEPMYEVRVLAPEDALGGVYASLSNRSAEVVDQDMPEGSHLVEITAHLAVRHSFGFTADLLERTSGKAVASMAVSHWALIESDPTDPTSEAGELVAAIRERKGMKPELPTFTL